MRGAILLITIRKVFSMARAFRLSSAIAVHNVLLDAAVLVILLLYVCQLANRASGCIKKRRHAPVSSLAALLGFTRARQELL
jgi:hypothetical protein